MDEPGQGVETDVEDAQELFYGADRPLSGLDIVPDVADFSAAGICNSEWFQFLSQVFCFSSALDIVGDRYDRTNPAAAETDTVGIAKTI